MRRRPPTSPKREETHQGEILYVSATATVVDRKQPGADSPSDHREVSSALPDRHNDKGFAYICRDGRPGRGCAMDFTPEETGERLSHAV